MELGEKLKNARLEAGLSQRQLCGDIITRNMLSQIENGSAKPSYATLQALAARLGKPLRYFWEDAPSENLSVLHQAQQAEPKEALEILKAYASPDPVLDGWYDYLTGRCYLTLAEEAFREGRKEDARLLLQKARQESPKFSYHRDVILLSCRLEPQNAMDLISDLPDNTREQLFRAKVALERGDTKKCLAFLETADRQTEEILLLMADVHIGEKAYQEAIDTLSKIPEIPETYSRFELCYRELGNFERAYYYACKRR